MNKTIFLCSFAALLVACHGKSDKSANGQGAYVSVVSYLNAQARQIDTSLYRITVIQTEDSLSDTTIIARENFRDYAKDFLKLPDIASNSLKDHYTEAVNYDPVLNSQLITYTAKEPEDEVRRETIMMETDENVNSSIKTIIINKIETSKDSTVEKDMTWHVGSRFQVVTKTRKTDQPEIIRMLLVKWE
jgi:hypothetical protein